jgi:bifunctional DNA-binding transcriptional regulator/antitoxin component of YhaV-PrlF toxin-antitoxin module
MPTLTLTSKRQATLPVETCRELGLRPGDQIELEARQEAGGRVWVLRRRESRTRKWAGCLAAYAARVEDHSMEAVRKSIATRRPRAEDRS